MIDPFYSGDRFTLYNGDCLAVMAQMEACSVDAIVTDPPAGIGMMNKDWDHNRGGRDQWVAWLTEVMRECLRVLKPGGHALVWALPRTSHWTGWAIESAGFEVRDRVSHLFGTGFPKSLDVSKAIDAVAARTPEATERLKAELRRVFEASGLTLSVLNERCGFEASGYLRKSSTWAFVLPSSDKWWKMREVIGCDDSLSPEFKEIERQVVGQSPWLNSANYFVPGEDHTQRLQLVITAPATDAAKQWSGWGTALKPACEDWWLCRKPLNGTVAQNVLKHGTGALNVDGCRIPFASEADKDQTRVPEPIQHNDARGVYMSGTGIGRSGRIFQPGEGRWPANVTHDGSDEVVGLFPETHGPVSNSRTGVDGACFGHYGARERMGSYTDSGSAARFFYCAKPDKADREAGLQDLPLRSAGDVTDRTDGSDGLNSPRAGAGRTSGARNVHPTIKSTELMRWLCRLITPPCGLVLDPFCGSGSTGKAAMLEGFRFIGIELSTEYCELAQRRIEAVTAQQGLFTPEQLAATQDDEPAQSGLFATVGE